MLASLMRKAAVGLFGLAAVYVLVAFGGARGPDRWLWIFGMSAAGLLALLSTLLGVEDRRQWRWPALLGILLTAYLWWRSDYADVRSAFRAEAAWMLACWGALTVGVAASRSSRGDYHIALALISIAVIEGLFGLSGWLSKATTIFGAGRPEQFLGRAAGSFINPNHFAAFVGYMFPVAVALLVRGNRGYAVSICLAYAALVLAGSVLVSGSRSGLVAMVLGSLPCLGLLPNVPIKRRRAIAVVFGGAIGVAIFLGSTLPIGQRLLAVLKAKNWSEIEVRQHLWKAGFQMWSDNRWMGVGPGHFDVRFPQYRSLDVQTRPVWPHSEYVSILSEHGTAGLVMAMMLGVPVMVVVGRRYGRDVVRATSNDEAVRLRGALTAGFVGALVVGGVQAAFDFTWHLPATAGTLCLVLGMLVRPSGWLPPVKSRSYWDQALRITCGGCIVAALIWNSNWAVRGWFEQRLIMESKRRDLSWSARIANLREAAGNASVNPEVYYRLGELLRLEAFHGDPGFEMIAEDAVKNFSICLDLNPFDPMAAAHLGMCLDWLGRHDEAERRFLQARNLDSASLRIAALMGWHRFQQGDFDDAKKWFEEALNKPHIGRDTLAESYWPHVNRMLEEKARTGRTTPSETR